ncbi:MAG: pilus assembly protein PilM [Parcubacteria group bacterium]|nr:pilus assembly protein PilM [Parcubacteria group bacterium]
MGIFDKIIRREKVGHHALALDIGTEVVKALIFEIDAAEGKGKVVGVGRRQQRLGDMQAGGVTDIEGVVRTCEKALEEAAEETKVRPDQIILGIAGELVKGTTTTVHYERLKPKSKIDLSELKNIIHKVQWKAFDKVRKQLSWETGHNEMDVRLINAAIVDVKIDGYKITNPLGFQGKDVSISIFDAYAPLVHLGALQTIATELDMDLLSIAAEPYAVARCVGSEDSVEFNAVFMDVGGGTTDIAVVRNGGLEGTKMFALGGRAFTKRVANELGISFTEAEKVKIDYSKGSLTTQKTRQVKNILDADCKVWLSGVELALSEFSNIDLLPARILLCGGGSVLPGIKSSLLSETWTKNLPFAKPPRVSFIQPKDVANIVDETGKLINQQDITPMALANLAIDLAGEEDILHRALRKVVRIMQT